MPGRSPAKVSAHQSRALPLVIFTPSGKRGRFAAGITVLKAARELGVDLDSICGGRALCGRCQVECSSGDFPKWGLRSSEEHLSPFSQAERDYNKRRGNLAPGCRLGCQTKILDNVVIDVPPSSQIHRQLVRKELEVGKIDLNPSVTLHYVEVVEPDMHNPASDLQRLRAALVASWGLGQLEFGPDLLASLQQALRQENWKVTVAVHEERRLVAVWPGFCDQVYGVAFDIGSTTIAAHLCSLVDGSILASEGRMNPQIRFGEDLMSRVSYSMMNPGGAKAMTDAVRQGIRELIERLSEAAGIDSSHILEVTVAGNPIMHHLALGIDPVELGGAPFALAADEAMSLPAAPLNFGLSPGARAFIFPCIAGHVGADMAAVLLAEQPQKQSRLTLIVDIGTNAELVLGNRRGLIACSSPTGPAFEGAQISCGQRAAKGAIERVRIDRETLEPKVRIIGCELWSDEEGFDREAKPLGGVTGVCGSGIIELIAELFLAGVIRADGTLDGSLASRTPRIIEEGRTASYLISEGPPRLVLTQNDVRQIQLAKAALYAGARLLMDRLGIDRLDRIRLAGAFGSHIDVRYAMVLGMIPDCKLEEVRSIGNAAGSGSYIALLDRDARQQVAALARSVTKIETAIEPSFQKHFVEAMGLPHATHAFPCLAREVDLPTPAPIPAQAGGGRRRRSSLRRTAAGS